MTRGSRARSSGEALLEGRLGRLPSSGCLTVVKQMLYSWMMEGYRLLKSSSSTNLSYRPFLGSRTRPPAYWGALRFLPPPPAFTNAVMVLAFRFYAYFWLFIICQTRPSHLLPLHGMRRYWDLRGLRLYFGLAPQTYMGYLSCLVLYRTKQIRQ